MFRLYFLMSVIVVFGQCNTTNNNPISKQEIKSNAFAKNFSILTKDNYKILTIPQAWKGANKAFEYVLYPKNTPKPNYKADAVYIPIPVERIVCNSTIQVAMLDFIGQTTKIVGINNGKYLYNSDIYNQLAIGKITDLGNDASFNYEQLVTLKPDIVLLFGMDGESKLARKLTELNIPSLYVAEYMETTPLGRAEWLKVLAALLDLDSLASEKFTKEVALPYQELVAKVPTTPMPTVLTGIAYEGTWYVAGGNSFMSKLIADAGGNYLWKDNTETGGLPLAFEAVFAKGIHADVWLNVSEARNLGALAQFDARYTQFAAFQQQRVFSYSKRVSANGGYDVFESAVIRPHLILKDLIQIFHHPNVPKDSLMYYEQLAK